MSRKFAPLSTTHIPAGMPFARPKELPEILHLQDSAFDAMLCLRSVKPAVISPDQRMYDARVLLQENEIFHTVFVADKKGGLVGLLSLEKILTEIPIQKTGDDRVKREKILVKDIMRPIHEVTIIDFDELKNAKIGDVVETFNDRNQHYALVLQYDEKTDTSIICGIFLASLLSEQLRMDILSAKPSRAKTIAELNHILHSNHFYL